MSLPLEELARTEDPEVLGDYLETAIADLALIDMTKDWKKLSTSKIADEKRENFAPKIEFPTHVNFLIDYFCTGNLGKAVVLSGVLAKLHSTGVLEDFSYTNISKNSKEISKNFKKYWKDIIERTNPKDILERTTPYEQVWIEVQSI